MSLNAQIQAFTRKLERWAARVKLKWDEFKCFLSSVNTVTKSITTQQALLENFNKYSREETAPEQYHWTRSPFTVTTASHLTSDLEDALIELF